MVSKRSLIRSLKSSIFRDRPGSMKFILLGPDITLKNFPRMFYIFFFCARFTEWTEDSRSLESINLAIQTTLQISRPIRPLQIILGKILQTTLQISRPIRPLQIILGKIHVNYHTNAYFISDFSSYLDHSASQNYFVSLL